jgi:DNA-binding transcriptional LysR family regulator
MAKLPDFEGLAVFAKVVEIRSFAGAATELKLSKATVSKAVSRIEARLGTRLINRTSRRFAMTDAGRQLAARAAHILAEGEAAEDAALAQATVPRGLVRLRLCEMPRYLVGSPAYLNKYGTPRHPLHLAQHRCIGYGHTMTAETWRFTKAGKSAIVRSSGPLRVNNGHAMPALIAGTGVGILPEFIFRDALAAGRLERLLPDWSLPSGGVYWVTPPGGPRPKRVEVLGDFLFEKLSRQTKRGARVMPTSVLMPTRKARHRRLAASRD